MRIILLFWNLQWLVLLSIFGKFNGQYGEESWPLSNSSTIRLLGLFQDEVNGYQSIETASHCRAMFKAAVILSQQYDIKIDGQYINWQVGETQGQAIHAIRSACDALSAYNIIGIVGPVLSREIPIIAEFGNQVKVPVISHAATDPNLSDRATYPVFYRTVPSDNNAATAIVKLFLRFNWTSCIIIHQNDAYGFGGLKAITEAFAPNGFIVTNTLVFDISKESMRDNLKNILTSSSSRIVILWVEANYVSSIVTTALYFDVLGPHFTWILSTSVPLHFNDISVKKLIGILTVEPTSGNVFQAPINTTLLQEAYNIWQQYEPETFPNSNDVDYFALFAFDATWTLIQSLKEFCSRNIDHSSLCISFLNTSSCFDRLFLDNYLYFNIIDNMTFLGVSGPVQFSSDVTDRINGCYYIAKNYQHHSNGPDFVPVLRYSVENDWEEYSETRAIIWPGNSLTPPTGRAQLLGVKLRIGVIESYPFTIVTSVINEFGQNITKFTGYIPDLIDHLQKKMGFIPNIELISNQTYASLGKLIENGMYDIIVGDVTVTSLRREKVGFSQAIFENSLRIIMRETPNTRFDPLAFLKPFTLSLWLLILGTTIMTGILICLLERQKDEKRRKQSVMNVCAMAVWYTFGNLIGFGADFNVRTASGRLLTAGLYLLCLVLVASYTANLTSDLTIAKSKNVISGIDDIKNGKIPFNRIGIVIGTASEEFYLREISSGNRNFYPLKSRKEMYDSLVNNLIDVIFNDAGVAEYLTNNIYCNATLIGEDFDKGVFGIITPKQWLYGQDLDVHILSLKESGVLDDLRRTWFQVKKCPDSSVTSTAIGIESLLGLFVIFGVICILSLSLFAWEKRTIFFEKSKKLYDDIKSISDISHY
ncbi:unnamed protein product [Rotaria sp. Silwood1]|nr:unnamed protein product [Rotaria sp. Silwood1]CAF4804020.1 unnamed protein product [Rotaria sp. Silwood1]